MSTCLTKDSKGFISGRDLLNRLDTYYKENGLPLLTGAVRRSILSKVQTQAQKWFLVDCQIGRSDSWVKGNPNK
jgi:hypothetical protein